MKKAFDEDEISKEQLIVFFILSIGYLNQYQQFEVTYDTKNRKIILEYFSKYHNQNLSQQKLEDCYKILSKQQKKLFQETLKDKIINNNLLFLLNTFAFKILFNQVDFSNLIYSCIIKYDQFDNVLKSVENIQKNPDDKIILQQMSLKIIQSAHDLDKFLRVYKALQEYGDTDEYKAQLAYLLNKATDQQKSTSFIFNNLELLVKNKDILPVIIPYFKGIFQKYDIKHTIKKIFEYPQLGTPENVVIISRNLNRHITQQDIYNLITLCSLNYHKFQGFQENMKQILINWINFESQYCKDIEILDFIFNIIMPLISKEPLKTMFDRQQQSFFDEIGKTLEKNMKQLPQEKIIFSLIDFLKVSKLEYLSSSLNKIILNGIDIYCVNQESQLKALEGLFPDNKMLQIISVECYKHLFEIIAKNQTLLQYDNIFSSPIILKVINLKNYKNQFPFIKKTCEEVHKYASLINEKELTLKQVYLMLINTQRYLKDIVKSLSPDFTDELFDEICKTYHEYEHTFRKINNFKNVCKEYGRCDIEEMEQFLRHIEANRDLYTIQEVSVETFWKGYDRFQSCDLFYHFRESYLIENILKHQISKKNDNKLNQFDQLDRNHQQKSIEEFDDYCLTQIFSHFAQNHFQDLLQYPEKQINYDILKQYWCGIDTRQIVRELYIVERYFSTFQGGQQTDFNPDLTGDLENFTYLKKDYEQTIQLIKLKHFAHTQNFDDYEDIIKFNQFIQFHNQINSTTTLKEISENIKSNQKSLEKYHSNVIDVEIVKELSKTEDLYLFILEKHDYDFKHLVETLDEQELLTEEVIKNMNDVQNVFLKIKDSIDKQNNTNYLDLCSLLQNEMKQRVLEDQEIILKIQSCVANLQGIITLVRAPEQSSENSQQIISTILEDGQLIFEFKSSDDEQCLFFITSKDKKYNIDEVYSHSNKALFKQKGKQQDEQLKIQEEVQKIAQCLTLSEQIIELLVELHEYGHMEFQQYIKEININEFTHDELRQLQDKCSSELQEYQNFFYKERLNNYFLSFFPNRKLERLYKYFQSQGTDYKNEIEDIFKFIFTNLDLTGKNLKIDTNPLCENHKITLSGEKLMELLADEEENYVKIQELQLQNFKHHLKHGKINFYQVKNDMECIQAIITLYTFIGYYPKAHEIMFCTSKTKIYEIESFLIRAFYAQQHFKREKLFILCNFEKINLQTQTEAYQLMNNNNFIPKDQNFYLYVLLQIAEQNDAHIIAELAKGVDCLVNPLSNDQIRALLININHITVYCSPTSGQGKTHNIKNTLKNKGLQICRIPMHGELSREKVIRYHNISLDRMNDNNFGIHYEILYYPKEDQSVNLIFFEILILRCINDISQSIFHMPKNHQICIEISSDLFKKFNDKQTIFHYFNKIELNWDINRLEIPQDPNNDIQFVCRFLHAIYTQDIRQSIENREILDTDNSVMSRDNCIQLLQKAFFKDDINDFNFNFVQLFIQMIKDSFKKFQQSVYFQLENLADQQIHPQERRVLLQASIDSFSEICKQNLGIEQKAKTNDQIQNQANSLSNLLAWQDNRPIINAFTEEGSLIILFKHLEDVQIVYREMYKHINGNKLVSYDDMTSNEIVKVIIDLCGNTTIHSLFNADETEKCKWTDNQNEKYKELHQKLYRLVQTKDTLLKLSLIYIKIRSNLPVLIMGETGIGKTAILTYLADVLQYPIKILNVHAGITEEKIIEFTDDCNKTAKANQNNKLIVFFDEVNTNDHVTSLLKEITIDRHLQGEKLSDNIAFISACNPYKLKGDKITLSAGIQRQKQLTEQSKLVYLVRPLSQTMLTFLFDFGSLLPNDEQKYIIKMITKESEQNNNIFSKQKCLKVAELIYDAQHFMKTQEAEWSVSLRDVDRFSKLLFYFFKNNLQSKDKTSNEIQEIAVILAVSFVYYFRISNKNLRILFIQSVYGNYNRDPNYDLNFYKILEQEQSKYLDQIELPQCIGKNTPLKENVFVTITCILNKIPVFITGKPGSSKTLAINLVTKSMRGKGSNKEFFQNKPALLQYTYQGSEQSTSAGIERIFQRAINCQKKFNEQETLAVVIIDEIGLAEISPHNPLKVLHSLLEPPKVPAIGISNWPLDAAKMNRGITLSRPDPDDQDLEESAISIATEIFTQQRRNNYLISFKPQIKQFVNGYQCLYKKQISPHFFHGLRDFYHFISFVCRGYKDNEKDNEENIIKGLQRNFGGLRNFDEQMNVFLQNVNLSYRDQIKLLTADTLVSDNLKDVHSRHLMLITENQEIAIPFIENQCIDLQKDYQIFYGSDFRDDQKEEAAYRLINQIILCMEKGTIAILLNLQSIYQSFYDMLNQNYQITGNQKFCKVAIGSESSRCIVHNNFKCILIAEENDVKQMDAPLLNRFDKQFYQEVDLNDNQQQRLIQELQVELEKISTYQGFERTETFPLLKAQNLITSAVVASRQIIDYQKRYDEAKHEIVLGANYAGLVRAFSNSQVLNFDQQQWEKELQYKQKINDLPSLLCDQKLEWVCYLQQKNQQNILKPLSTKWLNKTGFNLLIFTYSDIFQEQDLTEEFKQEFIFNNITNRIILREIFNERIFKRKIEDYFKGDSSLLLIFADSREDSKARINYCKSIINNEREQYSKSHLVQKEKHIAFIIKIDELGFDGFSYNSNWRQVMIDSLNGRDMSDIHVSELIRSTKQILDDQCLCQKFVRNSIVSAASRIIYGKDDQEQVLERVIIIKQVLEVPKMKDFFFKLIMDGIIENEKGLALQDCQLKISQNKGLIQRNIFFHSASMEFFQDLFMNYIAYFIYLFEMHGIFDYYQQKEGYNRFSVEEVLSIFTEIFQQHFSNYQFREKYELDKEKSFTFPFAQYIHNKLTNLKENFISNIVAIYQGDNDEEDIPQMIQQTIKGLKAQSIHIMANYEKILSNDLLSEQYGELFLDSFILLNLKLSDNINIKRQEQLFFKESLKIFLRNQNYSLTEIYGIFWKEEQMLRMIFKILKQLIEFYDLNDIMQTVSTSITQQIEEEDLNDLYINRETYIYEIIGVITKLCYPYENLLNNLISRNVKWNIEVEKIMFDCSSVIEYYLAIKETNETNIIKFLINLEKDLIIPLNLGKEILTNFATLINERVEEGNGIADQFINGEILEDINKLKNNIQNNQKSLLIFSDFMQNIINQAFEIAESNDKSKQYIVQLGLEYLQQDFQSNFELMTEEQKLLRIKTIKKFLSIIDNQLFVDYGLNKFLPNDNWGTEIVETLETFFENQYELPDQQNQEAIFKNEIVIIISDTIEDQMNDQEQLKQISVEQLELIIKKSNDEKQKTFLRIVQIALIKCIFNKLSLQIYNAIFGETKHIEMFEIKNFLNQFFNNEPLKSLNWQFYIIKYLYKNGMPLQTINEEVRIHHIQFNPQIVLEQLDDYDFYPIGLQHIEDIVMNYIQEQKEDELIVISQQSEIKMMIMKIFLQQLYLDQQQINNFSFTRNDIQKFKFNMHTQKMLISLCYTNKNEIPRVFQLKENKQLTIFFSYIGILLGSNDNKFFSFEYFAPDKLKDFYLPFQYTNSNWTIFYKNLTKREENRQSIYECNNELCTNKQIILTDDCGKIDHGTAEEGDNINCEQCSGCGLYIGAKDEQSIKNSKQIYQKKWYHYQEQHLADFSDKKSYQFLFVPLPSNFKIRQLDQIQSRIGNLILHSCLLIALEFYHVNDYQKQVFDLHSKEQAEDYLNDQIYSSLDSLKKLLNISQEEVIIILNKVVTKLLQSRDDKFSPTQLLSLQGLQQFEKTFAEEILEDYTQYFETIKSGDATLQVINEYNRQDPNNSFNQYLSYDSLLRARLIPSYDDLIDYLGQFDDSNVKAKFLQYVLVEQETIDKLCSLWSLLQWCKLSTSKKNKKITEDQLKLTVKELFEEEEILFTKQSSIWRKFVETWNDFVGEEHEFVYKPPCFKVKLPQLSDDTIFQIVTLWKDDDDFGYFYGFLKHFIDIQNNFLANCYELIQQLKLSIPILQEKHFLEVNQFQIINTDEVYEESVLLKNFYNSPSVGQGKNINFNLDSLCQYFIEKLLRQKVIIDLPKEGGYFKCIDNKEYYVIIGQYQTIHEKIKQVKYHKMQNFLDTILRIPKNWNGVYNVMITTINFLSQTSGSPSKSLNHYIEAFQKNEYTEMIPNDILLEHTLHLYEQLEHKLERQLIENTYDAYRDILGGSEEALINILNTNYGIIDIDFICTALAKLCIRQMRFRKQIGPQQSLFPYFFDEINMYLWGVEEEPELERFRDIFKTLDNITIAQAFETYQCIRRFLEDKAKDELRRMEEEQKKREDNERRIQQELQNAVDNGSNKPKAPPKNLKPKRMDQQANKGKKKAAI